LIQAVKTKDVQAVRALVKQRIDVNTPQGDGSTALHWAARIDDLAIADVLIRAGRTGKRRERHRCSAAASGVPEPERGDGRSAPERRRDANAVMLNGETVLMTCARSGNAKAVNALLVRGAKVNAKETGHEQTALMWAVAQSHPTWLAC
jgi:ankyrin repeat protein